MRPPPLPNCRSRRVSLTPSAPARANKSLATRSPRRGATARHWEKNITKTNPFSRTSVRCGLAKRRAVYVLGSQNDTKSSLPPDTSPTWLSGGNNCPRYTGNAKMFPWPPNHKSVLAARGHSACWEGSVSGHKVSPWFDQCALAVPTNLSARRTSAGEAWSGWSGVSHRG